MVLWTEPPPSSCRDSLSGTFSPALPAAHRCQHLVPLAQLYKRSTRNVMNPLSPDQIYSETEQTDAWTCPKVTGRCEIKPISASPSSSLVLLLLLASIQQNYCPSYFRASVLPVTALVFADKASSLSNVFVYFFVRLTKPCICWLRSFMS